MTGNKITLKELWRLLADDLPLSGRPYRDLGLKVNHTEEDVIAELKTLIAAGKVRRVAAILRHEPAGFKGNAMGVWLVPPERLDEVGKIAAGFDAVTHCYSRTGFEGWPYNLYTMIHGKNESDCYKVAAEISKAVGITEYKLLFTTRELKKTSFNPGIDNNSC
jgi:DNA-binding Lrp family transcriptional regulator